MSYVSGSRELALLEARLQLLADRASSTLQGLAALGARTQEQLGAWVRSRFQAECSAVAALEREARAAALAGTRLPHDLRLVRGCSCTGYDGSGGDGSGCRGMVVRWWP